MARTTETPQETPQARLDAARRATDTARATLEGIEARLRKAIEAQDFDTAAQLKREIPDAELAYAHAAADQRAIEIVIDDLARRRAQREAAEAAERRKQAAVGNLNAAAAREAELMDQLRTKHAELVAGVGAVKDTITAAYAIEQQVRQARADQRQARVDMGEQQPGMQIAAPNLVSAVVERSEALVSIMRGSALP
jgi:DNA repair exonuclease SbcCD ATPase subunit